MTELLGEAGEQSFNDRLDLLIEYDGYLNADQLSIALGSLEAAYTRLYLSLEPSLQVVPPEARLRIQTLRTGESVRAELVEGVRWVVDAGKDVAIALPLGVPGLVAALVTRVAKGVVDVRKSWHEGTLAKYQAREQRSAADQADRRAKAEADEAEANARRAAAEAEEAERRLAKIRTERPEIDERTLAEASGDAARFLAALHAPNIVRVTVNGVVVVGGDA